MQELGRLGVKNCIMVLDEGDTLLASLDPDTGLCRAPRDQSLFNIMTHRCLRVTWVRGMRVCTHGTNAQVARVRTVTSPVHAFMRAVGSVLARLFAPFIARKPAVRASHVCVCVCVCVVHVAHCHCSHGSDTAHCPRRALSGHRDPTRARGSARVQHGVQPEACSQERRVDCVPDRERF